MGIKVKQEKTIGERICGSYKYPKKLKFDLEKEKKKKKEYRGCGYGTVNVSVCCTSTRRTWVQIPSTHKKSQALL